MLSLLQVLFCLSLIYLVTLLVNYSRRKRKEVLPGPPQLPIFGSIPFIQLPFYRGATTLSKKYGDIYGIRLGAYPGIVLNTPQLIKEAYEDPRFLGRPALPFFKDRGFGKARGVIFSNGNVWKEQRRFTLQHLRDVGFSSTKLEGAIQSQIGHLIKLCSETDGRPTSLVESFRIAGVIIIWFIVTGKEYSNDDPNIKCAVALIQKLFKDVDRQGPVTFLPWLAHLAPKLSGWAEMMTNLDNIYDFFKRIVMEHKLGMGSEKKEGTIDFIDCYLAKIDATIDPESTFYGKEGETQLLVVLLDLYAVATDAVSNTLDWAFLYLITNLDVQDKLHEEIDSIVGRGKISTLADRARMPYMQAFIEETLRSASTGTIFPRATTEDLEFHGYTLRKNTFVFANFWKINHDEEYWGDPHTFRPERFLDHNGNFVKNDILTPFSIGNRSCPGEGIARDQTFLFLAGLLQNFKFTSAEPNPKVFPTNSVMPHAHPYQVVIRKRK